MEENSNDFKSESYLAHYLRLEFLDEATRNNFFVDEEGFMNHILKSTNPFFKAYQNGDVGREKLERDLSAISRMYDLIEYGDGNFHGVPFYTIKSIRTVKDRLDYKINKVNAIDLDRGPELGN